MLDYHRRSHCHLLHLHLGTAIVAVLFLPQILLSFRCWVKCYYYGYMLDAGMEGEIRGDGGRIKNEYIYAQWMGRVGVGVVWCGLLCDVM